MRTKSLIGVLSVNLKGFGFVATDDGGTDIYIAPDDLRGAMNGDKVKVRLVGSYRGRREGYIVEVLERATEIFVGTLNKVGNKVFVTPDDKRIGQRIILPKFREKFSANTKVVVKITGWEPLRGQVVEVLGKENVGAAVVCRDEAETF